LAFDLGKEVVMFNKVFMVVIVAAAFSLSSPTWSYEEAAAVNYGAMFSSAKGAVVGKQIHLIPADKFVDKVKAKKPLVVLDVRTPAEMGIIGMTLPGTLNIPLNELFTKANLDALPTDKPIIVVCQSGIRATAIGTALRHVGFKNVYILKGGMKALIGYLGPKEANKPLKQAEKK
jgi:rhodanese-related sulfurtransferase